jgi:hypothetical protein
LRRFLLRGIATTQRLDVILKRLNALKVSQTGDATGWWSSGIAVGD